MLQELIYTSAPKGLKPGSRGFCTVAATAGIAKNLADQLESLSGYRHLFPPNDPQASLNPVAYSHLILSVGGQTFHVLSRVAAAGFDYTQRTNKLAHHLAIPRGELSRCGPATLLTVPGNVVESWSGEPRQLPERRLKSALHQGACDYWTTVTGDAGWAGVLAATAVAQQQAVLVYRPGTDMLRLLEEALLLLPPEVQWKTTFSTYFTKLPAGLEARWRCLPEGAPELLPLRRVPNIQFFDLTKQLPAAPDGQWVTAARTGLLPSIPDHDPTGTGPTAGRQKVKAQGASSKTAGKVVSLGNLDNLPDALTPAMPVSPVKNYAGGWQLPVLAGASVVLVAMVLLASLLFLPRLTRYLWAEQASASEANESPASSDASADNSPVPDSLGDVQTEQPPSEDTQSPPAPQDTESAPAAAPMESEPAEVTPESNDDSSSSSAPAQTPETPTEPTPPAPPAPMDVSTTPEEPAAQPPQVQFTQLTALQIPKPPPLKLGESNKPEPFKVTRKLGSGSMGHAIEVSLQQLFAVAPNQATLHLEGVTVVPDDGSSVSFKLKKKPPAGRLDSQEKELLQFNVSRERGEISLNCGWLTIQKSEVEQALDLLQGYGLYLRTANETDVAQYFIPLYEHPTGTASTFESEPATFEFPAPLIEGTPVKIRLPEKFTKSLAGDYQVQNESAQAIRLRPDDTTSLLPEIVIAVAPKQMPVSISGASPNDSWAVKVTYHFKTVDSKWTESNHDLLKAAAGKQLTFTELERLQGVQKNDQETKPAPNQDSDEAAEQNMEEQVEMNLLLKQLEKALSQVKPLRKKTLPFEVVAEIDFEGTSHDVVIFSAK